jgi:peptidylprolyl isomerase
MKRLAPVPAQNRCNRAAAVLLTAALFLSACGGAEPADQPTPTPYESAPTPANIVNTATPNVGGTATAQARVAKAGDTTAASVGGAERRFAGIPPEQRNNSMTEPPPLSIDVTRKYYATIHLQKGGEIKLELDPGAAPKTVNNFVYLAMQGFYDGVTFHRVLPGFMAQGGDPSGTGAGGPGYQFEDEKNNFTFAEPGVIAMANAGPNTNGSQFFITYGTPTYLDGRHTIFGKVIAGKDVLEKITPRDPEQNPTTPGDAIDHIHIELTSITTVPIPTPVPTATPVPIPAACNPYPLNVKANDHILGKADAIVTLVEYGDMQCPACAGLHPSLKRTMAVLSDSVRLVFRHFPLPTIHDKAIVAARGMEAAALQGKFWELQDALYTKQAEWDKQPATQITETLKTFAKDLGMDVAKFESDLASTVVIERIAADMKAGEGLNIQGTPTIFLDGRPINPEALSSSEVITQFKGYIDSKAKDMLGKNADVNFEQPENVVEAGAMYVMTIKTTRGDIVAEIDPKLAPLNVNSTLFLAQKGYFNNTTVALNDSQIGAVLMGTSTRSGNPGYDCATEKSPTESFAKPGVVALFGDGTRSNTQLIFTYTPTQMFQERFSVIGQITQGLDIVQALQGPGPEVTSTQKADSIVSVEVKKK